MGSTPGAERLVVVGQGYVGLPLAVRACEAGFDVVGLDVDASRVSRLAAGESITEDITASRLAAALETGRYRPTSDPGACAGFAYGIICVPTPLAEGAPDLSHIESAARSLARHLRPGATVVLESTTYPGTTEERVGPLLEEGSGLAAGEFHLGYSPERLSPGDPELRFETTPKVVSGVDEGSLAAVQGLYERLVDRTVAVSGTREAELTKLLENTFRHVNVALMNELAMFANSVGIDIWEAIDAAATKPYGFLPFRPGPGVGGHCLPVDPSYLSWRVQTSSGQPLRFVELANEVNDHMPHYVVRRLEAALNSRELPVKGARLLLLGLSYKRNTGDTRESPALEVARLLLDMGAEVRASDPHVRDALDARITQVEVTAEEMAAADAVVVLVDHDAFDLPAVIGPATYVLDTRHCVSGARVEHL